MPQNFLRENLIPFQKYQAKKQKENRKAMKNFEYSEDLHIVLNRMSSEISKIGFLPFIFHGRWQDRYKAYSDFSEFYLSEFDDAYYSFHSANQKYEKEYPFQFPPREADILENELWDCLTKLISLFPEKNNSNITEIMWQSCKLFELYHNLDDLFS